MRYHKVTVLQGEEKVSFTYKGFDAKEEDALCSLIRGYDQFQFEPNSLLSLAEAAHYAANYPARSDDKALSLSFLANPIG